jgi:hypothetical protein
VTSAVLWMEDMLGVSAATSIQVMGEWGAADAMRNFWLPCKIVVPLVEIAARPPPPVAYLTLRFTTVGKTVDGTLMIDYGWLREGAIP